MRRRAFKGCFSQGLNDKRSTNSLFNLSSITNKDDQMAVSGFNAELGQQQFLELMVKQLQYQDPLEPVGQQEFLQQMAQFSMVEGVEQLNTQFADVLKLQTLNQGTDLIGQTVEYQDAATGDRVQGRVNETRVIEGQLTLLVDDQRIPLAAVDAIIAADPAN
ncbi:hypothetical protein OAF42_03655 [Planctomicrobium sp.]|nr:flagellar hook capping FlgD N-terminal domain-containing protein [Planctomicrobium sp.]MDB4733519.1 hypothetical protein [Planctomicrobium sp.]